MQEDFKPAHINAFQGAVEAAKVKVAQAEGELANAIAALVGHPDYVEPEPEKKTVVKPAPKTIKVTTPKTSQPAPGDVVTPTA